jgi:flagellum-specific ATP synthase
VGILAEAIRKAGRIDPVLAIGRVCMVRGLLVESTGPRAVLGELCRIEMPRRGLSVEAEVVGLGEKGLRLMAYDSLEGIEIGSSVTASGRMAGFAISESLLGRVIDARGRALDGLPPPTGGSYRNLAASAPSPLTRRRIDSRFLTGIKAVDGLVPLGKGQRIGVFAGSGVGKSTLLGMMARGGRAAVNVIALIGERGREVREFVEGELGKEGLSRSVVVVSTSDSPALARLRGALLAMSAAEYFRDRGLDVLLVFDSLSRLAKAQREIGIASGEPLSARGYPPSVFDMLPRLLERAGMSDKGSITGIYSVLVEGDDPDEPIADALRSMLDGHILLSRSMAEHGRYPAIDILKSLSRVEASVTSPAEREVMRRIRAILAVYDRYEDMIAVGAYLAGSSAEVDEAIRLKPGIDSFLSQDRRESFGAEEIREKMLSIFRHEEVIRRSP